MAERHSRTGKPTVELGDASHLKFLLLPDTVVQARLISAKSKLMLLPAIMTGTWDWHWDHLDYMWHSVKPQPRWNPLSHAVLNGLGPLLQRGHLPVSKGPHLDCGPLGSWERLPDQPCTGSACRSPHEGQSIFL